MFVLLVISCAGGPVISAQARTFSPARMTGAASSGAPQPLGQTGGWNLIFSDEFGGTALDRTNWTPGWFGTGITGPVNSSELACYDSAHVTEPGDGNLHLRLDATANTCKGSRRPYTGALISSNGLFQYAYGYVEFRVYQPAASSATVANWPATWSDGQSWPADGENDTMEALGGQACYHFHSSSGGPGSCAGGDYSGWHTYASYWHPGVVTYFYDGVQVGQITTGITSAPQYLIVDYTISPSSVAAAPNEMLVDYLRVWTAGMCASAGISADHASPQVRGTQIAVTATSSGCGSPNYEFWLRYPNGSWVVKRGFSSSSSWTWDTTGYPAGSYNLHVWANQQGTSTSTWQAYGELLFTISPPPPCSAAGLSPATVTQAAGSTVALSPSAGGCPDPRYEYWVQIGGKWYLKRGFSSDPAWSWSTAGLRPGSYSVHVWANQAGDQTTSWEAWAGSTVTLTGCTTATLSSATVTGGVKFTAGSTGCPNPVYEYWLQDTQGVWHRMTGFIGNTWTWNTAGWAKGTYNVHVWANQQGSDYSAWQAYGSSTFILT